LRHIGPSVYSFQTSSVIWLILRAAEKGSNDLKDTFRATSYVLATNL